MLEPNIAGGNYRDRPVYLLRLAVRMAEWNCGVWQACSWSPNGAFFADWYDGRKEWLSDMSADEQLLFILFIREALLGESN